MEVIQLHDAAFRSFIPAHVIRDRVAEMAMRMNAELRDEKPLFIGILTGVFMFATDLMRGLDFDSEITFVKLSSYEGTSSTGKVQTVIGLNKDLSNRTVVILEDIVDTGRTLSQFIPFVKTLNPERLLVAVLLLKPRSIEYELQLDYIGF